MARVRGRAHAVWDTANWKIGDRPEWKLIFRGGWERILRLGGFYAGHETLSSMKKALFEEIRTQQNPSSPQSLTYSEDNCDADGEESSSLIAPSRIEQYSQDDGEVDDDESMKPHKRRKAALAASEGEEDGPADCRQDELQRGRVDNRSTSLVPWEPVPEFSSGEGFRPLLGKNFSHGMASPSSFELNIRRAGNVSKRQKTEGSALNVLRDKREPGIFADMYVLKCGDCMVPVTNLPICIGGMVCGGAGDQDIFLTGRFGGRTKSFAVDRWKLLISVGSQPCFMVKTTGGLWLRLLQPHTCYLKTISDCYVVAHFLDYVKRTPSASVFAVERHLAAKCSMYGQEPFLVKLSKHLRVIRSFVDEDEVLKNASVLRAVFPNLFAKDPKELRGDSSQKSRQLLRSVLGLNGHRAEENETETDDRRQNVMFGDSLLADENLAEGYEEVPRVQGLKTDKDHGTHGSEQVARQDKTLKRSRPSNREQERHAKDDGKKSIWTVNSNRLQSGSEYSQIVCRGGVSKKAERKSLQRSQMKAKKMDDPPICVLCDDGGNLLICDGPCCRYFHAVPRSGTESCCQTLGLSRKETKAERWYCKNCEQKQQQCFICSELGSTDKAFGRPEVYICEVPSCKRFYHAHCVAELVDFPNWRTKADGIRNGTERVICPRHKCDTCRLTEMTPGSLVQCRRCPKAWHRECFTNYSLSGELRTTTIWNHDQQEFVYCRQHKINPALMTPDRDHVHFPEVVNNKIKKIRFKSSGLNGTIIERQYCETQPPRSLAVEMGLLSQ